MNLSLVRQVVLPVILGVGSTQASQAPQEVMREASTCVERVLRVSKSDTVPLFACSGDNLDEVLLRKQISQIVAMEKIASSQMIQHINTAGGALSSGLVVKFDIKRRGYTESLYYLLPQKKEESPYRLKSDNQLEALEEAKAL